MILAKEDNRGRMYKTDEQHSVLYRKQGSVTGDNAENRAEVLYLVSGEARITCAERIYDAVSPARIIFEANTYHKIEALTDVILVLLAE